MFLATLIGILLTLCGPAGAGVNRAVLGAVYVDPTPGAVLPLQLNFRDDSGKTWSLKNALGNRPSVLIFADYTCHTLCGPILDFTAAALEKSGLKPGADYRLIVIGIDPKDGLNTARAMKTSHLDHDEPITRASLFLTGSKAAIDKATSTLGYHFVYDAEHDQFAHPAAVFVLTRDGKVTRVLSGIGLNGGDLRLALVEAGQGQIGTLTDRFRLLCYGYDPALGIYTARINFLLNASCIFTLVIMLAGFLVMHRLARARARARTAR